MGKYSHQKNLFIYNNYVILKFYTITIPKITAVPSNTLKDLKFKLTVLFLYKVKKGMKQT